jgi:hypothetical protein
MFCRLKDFRRNATRYDKLATNFLTAVQLAAIVSYRLESQPYDRRNRCMGGHTNGQATFFTSSSGTFVPATC